MTREPSHLPQEKHLWRPRSLRLSVTDRCFLRCRYCMPDNVQFVDHHQILHYGQMLVVVDALRAYGLEKVRITGGEPLVRRDVHRLVASLKERTWLRRVGMTTNGYLLSEYAERLYDAGLRSLNISLDTIDEEQYEKLTGRPFLRRVLEGIDTALSLGFSIKVNSVPIRGSNEDQIVPLLRWASELGIEVRFIEYMPFGSQWSVQKMIAEGEILRRIAELGPVIPLGEESGHTRRYCVQTEAGEWVFGIIPAVTKPFCDRCDRLRLTATGELLSCMFDRDPIAVARAIRSYDADGLSRLIKKALQRKPAFLASFRIDSDQLVEQGLHSIGG